MTVGEMSALFGINVQTLHYYDSIGILKPEIRDPETGRRKYPFGQVYNLASILFLRKLGYSLKQIEESINGRSMEHSLEQLRDQSRVLRQQIEDLEALDRAIGRKISFMEQELANIDRNAVTVRSFPERGYIKIGSEDVLYNNDSFYIYPTIAFYEHSLKYFGAYLFCEDANPRDACWGTDHPQYGTIPAGDYLCGYHYGPYETIMESASVLRQKGARMDLTMDSLLINFNIVDQFVEGDADNYITMMQIPILDE